MFLGCNWSSFIIRDIWHSVKISAKIRCSFFSHHLLKGFHSFGEGWMGIEKAGKPAYSIVVVFERINNIKMGGGFIGGFQGFAVAPKFFESRDESAGLAGEFD